MANSRFGLIATACCAFDSIAGKIPEAATAAIPPNTRRRPLSTLSIPRFSITDKLYYFAAGGVAITILPVTFR